MKNYLKSKCLFALFVFKNLLKEMKVLVYWNQNKCSSFIDSSIYFPLIDLELYLIVWLKQKNCQDIWMGF